MSYKNPRIGMDDTVMDIIVKMSGGNPGAMTVLVRMYKEGGMVDPDDFMGGLGSILGLDTADIYEDRIWMLYKDVCGENLVTMLGLLRAVQLGYLSESKLINAIDGIAPLTIQESMDVITKVRERLPNFGRVPV
jgi:hypothetical protein